MSKLPTRQSQKIGLPPGTAIYTGKKKGEVKIEVIDYSDPRFEQKSITKIEDLARYRKSTSVSWVNVNGINNVDVLKKIGEIFDIHPLIIEDIANVNQRPKMEEFEDYVFVVMKMIYYNQGNELTFEQISFIIAKNLVITFQETEGDVFDSIRQRIKEKKGRLRSMGSDYLAYALIDTLVDHYFIVLEKVGEDIQLLEDELLEKPSSRIANKTHRLKSELLFLRKSIWPLREVTSNLQRDESKIITKGVRVYMKDVYDHTVQIMDTVETFRDMLSGMLEVYLSSISNRLNEIMKVLTIIGTIFIPLTFIVGVYGMNFHYMPELSWKYSYPILWGVMIALGVGMLMLFRRKKWI